MGKMQRSLASGFHLTWMALFSLPLIPPLLLNPLSPPNFNQCLNQFVMTIVLLFTLL